MRALTEAVGWKGSNRASSRTEACCMETLARWMLRHRRVVVVLWVVAVAAIWGLGRLVPAHYSFGDSLPNTESRAAADLLQREFPGQPGEVDTIVWKVDSGSVRDPQVRQRMRQMLSAVRDLPHVTGVQSPYDAGGDSAISKDGRVAFALVNFDQGGDQLPKATVTKVIDTARGFATPAVSVDLGGYAIGQATMTISTSTSELVGVIAAAVVLFFAFGSLLGVSLPLISALASVIPAVALIGMLSRVLTVPSFASSLTILLNLGIGIDYALFLVTRQRRGLLAGQRVLDALVDTLRTAGRSVLFAGTIVCVALLGLFSLGVGYLSGMAASAAIGIAFTMAAALTLLPAMLGFFGERLLGRRERRRSLATGGRRTADSGGWVRWAGLVARRPLVLAAVATLVTVVLALPLFSIRLGFSDQGNDPTSRTTRRAYDTLAGGFGPGFNAPLFVVASTPGGRDQAAVQRLATAIAGTPGVAAVTPAQPSPSGRVAVLQAFPTTSPQSKATQDLLHRLRDRGMPQAIRGSGLAAHVGGFRDPGRLHRHHQQPAAAVHRSGRAAGRGAAAGRLPQPAGLRADRGDEPARHRGLLWCHRRGLPVGLGGRAAWPRPARTDRRLPAGVPVRDPVRPVHGLPGVPARPHARGVAAHPRQPAGGQHRADRNRPCHHRGRRHHGPGLPVLCRRRAGDEAFRHRHGHDRPAGRVRPPHHARAGPAAPVRPGQLVASGMAGPAGQVQQGRHEHGAEDKRV